MKKAALFAAAICLAFISTNASAQTAGDYRSAATGNWNAIATWETFNGTSWIAASATPTSADGAITIRSPHTVTISATVTYDQVVVDSGAQVTVAPTITSTLANGAGTDLTINGTWLNSGGTWTVTGATWTVGAGGTYIHNTTSSAATPLGAATFNAASTMIFRGSSTLNAAVSTAGRTFGNLSFESTSGTWSPNPVGGTALVVNGNFTIGSGVALTWGMTANPGHAIKGNISVASGGSLIFNPLTAGTLNLSGAAAQTITNSGTLTINSANQTIVVNNAAGVNLASNVTFGNGVLTLTTGNINTGANTLSIGSAASVTRTAGYVIGNLKKTFAAATSKVFEVGTVNGYSPVTANVTAATFPADLTIKATQGAQPNMTAGTSILRYWTLTATNSPTADLTFQYLAGDVQGNENIYKVFRVSGGTPVSFPASVVDTGLHTGFLAGVNSFSDWTVGEAADTTPPAVTSVTVPANGTYASGQNLDFTVNFSEPVTVTTGGGTPRIPITLNTGGTVYANYVSGSGSLALLFSYQVVSGNEDPDGITVGAAFEANGGTIKDAAGNDALTTLNGVGSTTGVLVDGIAPDVASITRVNASPTAASSVDFTVTFSESVTGVDAADFTLTTTGLTGSSVTGVTGSGTTRTVTVNTGSGTTGTLRLDVISGATFSDVAGNAYAGGGFTTGESYAIDRNAPSVQSVTRNDPNPNRNTSVAYTVTFSQSVTGVDPADFTLTSTGVTGPSVGTVTGSGNTYTVNVSTGTGDGTIRLDVFNDGSIQSGTNVPLSGGTFTTGEVYTIDKTAPFVQSIVRANATPTAAATVNFTVTYSEPVSGVSAQDWALTTTGVSGASVTGFTGSGTTYNVTVNTGSGDGTIRLDVVTGGTVIDAAGNLLATGFTSGEVYAVDKTAPSVVSINRADVDPTAATSVNFTVTFSEAVTGVDSSDFALAASGPTGASITGVTGSLATYTVTVNRGTGNGTLGLNLIDNDSIIDGASNPLGGTGAGNGNFTGQIYTITSPPAAPGSLVASAADSHVLLTWNAAAGASTYNVKRSTTNNTSYSTIASGIAVTNYDDTTAVNGTTYFYKVSGTNGVGEGPDSNEVSATPAPPGPPPGPVSIAVGDAKVILSWPPVGGATSYNVKRGTTTGVYTVTNNTPVPTYTDSTVANGTTYYYVVTALSPAESAPSSEVSGTPNTPNVLGIVFSTVYGGGGNAGATLKNDYMELFNRGTQTVSLNGWSVQYTSATATTWTATNSPTALSGTIAPGRYYLVQEAAGAGGTVNLPTPDATGNIAMGATAGKVALVGNTVSLTGQCPTGTFIADFVGYGPTANCSETSPTAVLTNTTAALRNSNGCTDTNNNANDFTVGAPNPRNSASPVNNCSIVNNPPTITPPADPIASVAQDAAPFTVNLAGSDDGGVYVWSATAGTGIQNVTVSNGQSTANVTYTVTLVSGFNGTATFTATLSDGINPAVNQTVHIQVTAAGGNNPPVITPPANPITTVAQDPPPFTVNLSGTDDGGVFNWTATPGTGVASVNVTGGQGTATVTYTVTLNAGFNGTATFTATLSDNVNPNVNQAVNINVLPAGATPNHVVISQLYGGGGNSGATFTNDFIELFNPTASPVSLAGWSVQYSPATNTGAFTGLQPIGGTIGPGEYYLISLASGGAVGSPLPTANVVNNSGFNMSGTTGKVALVSTGTPVPGPCSATTADTDIVDLVGYGSANCNEGGTNAPTPSNTTSDFRKNGGNTDTNVNGNDFITATPNPRRTTPIQEFGPAIVNTDPVNNATAAPRDASMIVTFTELVDVDPGWFNINCSVTGLHNDATFVEGAPDTWVITPNVNFVAAEQCSVTIFKNSVHDRDTDDSVPGTDTLPNDYTWTFTVSTGTLPPYPSNVHLTMGNPSNATTSLSNPNNYLMQKPEMAISYSRDLGRPNWVSWHLTDEWVGSLTRVDTFRPDPEVPPAWYRVLASDFFASGFDRGHMTPNADRDKETSIPINQATFLMSNMVAQAPDNNQGPWADLENYLRTLLPADELYIVSGPAGQGGTGSNGGTTMTVANGHVTVPSSTWKCALVLPKASGDDIARVTASTQTICVIMPNIQGIRNDDWHIYLKSVDQVEALSGYDLFSNVPLAIQNAIEAGVNGANPPGTADQSTSTSEDVAKSITLDAASPGGALTYTILTGPFHGNLTGTGANRTYTPAPDYNGTDTFTWRVNDGTNNSNTSTFTLNITEVNDPPVATDDSKSTTANNALTFPGSDLTTNDSVGPVNEAGQTLTVTNVTATVNTHGFVALNSGNVTYLPDAGYTGPASFSYTVCDNGTTAGSLDAQCTTGTVNVTVSPQVATHFSVTAPANTTSGTPFNVTVTALDGSNVTVTGYTGTVHFTSSSAGSLPADYTFVVGDNGAHTFSVTLTSTGAQSVTATDTVTASITGSANTTVAPPPATHFSVSAPANVTSGVAFNVTVTALDASNATVTGYTGTVHFTSSSAGTLPSDYTFVGGDSGSHTFSVTLTSTGAQSVTTTDTVTASITGSANTTVAPPPATHFSVTAPANVTSGAAFNVTVTALDASNATVTGYTGTVHFTSSSAGPLPADYTFVGGDNGAHTFSVTLTSTGSQSVTATDTVTASITGTTNTTVAAPPATHFSVTAPANVTSGVAFNVTVTALDASNATVTGYTGTVHFTSSSAGTLPADYTFVGGDNGAHTFSVTLTSTGSQSITATDTVTASITGSANTTVAAPPATHFSVTAPANVTSGVAFNVTVTALDASNAIVTGYTGTVHFTSSSAGTLPADYTFVGGDNGAHTFSVTLTNTGSQSVTATDTVTASITGTTNTTVAPPPATHFSVTAPASVNTGTPFNVTVTAQAASNATATGYTGTVHFTSSSAGTLPSDYTFVAGDNGTHTFSVTLTTTGSQTITATDTVTASITGTATTNVVLICPPGPAPFANASNSGPACAGTTVNLFSNGSGSVFSWTGPGGFTSSQQNPTGITVAGTYTVTVTDPGPCGGSAQASTTVVFNPIPSAAITTPATVCSTSASNSASVPSAGAGATYAWSITNGTITGGNGTPSIIYTAGSLGSVHLAVTVTSGAGCSASSTADAAIAPRPTITLPASIDVACGTTSVNVPFTLTGTGPWSILWSDGVTQSGITSPSSSRNVTVTGSMVLSAIVSDANCSNGSASVSINVTSAPVITTQPVGQIVQPSHQATFTVTASGAGLHYQWFVKHANGATVAVGTDSPSYTTNPEGNAIWFVRVTNTCGSIDSESVTALVVTPRHRASH